MSIDPTIGDGPIAGSYSSVSEAWQKASAGGWSMDEFEAALRNEYGIDANTVDWSQPVMGAPPTGTAPVVRQPTPPTPVAAPAGWHRPTMAGPGGRVDVRPPTVGEAWTAARKQGVDWATFAAEMKRLGIRDPQAAWDAPAEHRPTGSPAPEAWKDLSFQTSGSSLPPFGSTPPTPEEYEEARAQFQEASTARGRERLQQQQRQQQQDARRREEGTRTFPVDPTTGEAQTAGTEWETTAQNVAGAEAAAARTMHNATPLERATRSHDPMVRGTDYMPIYHDDAAGAAEIAKTVAALPFRAAGAVVDSAKPPLAVALGGSRRLMNLPLSPFGVEIPASEFEEYNLGRFGEAREHMRHRVDDLIREDANLFERISDSTLRVAETVVGMGVDIIGTRDTPADHVEGYDVDAGTMEQLEGLWKWASQQWNEAGDVTRGLVPAVVSHLSLIAEDFGNGNLNTIETHPIESLMVLVPMFRVMRGAARAAGVPESVLAPYDAAVKKLLPRSMKDPSKTGRELQKTPDGIGVLEDFIVGTKREFGRWLEEKAGNPVTRLDDGRIAVEAERMSPEYAYELGQVGSRYGASKIREKGTPSAQQVEAQRTLEKERRGLERADKRVAKSRKSGEERVTKTRAAGEERVAKAQEKRDAIPEPDPLAGEMLTSKTAVGEQLARARWRAKAVRQELVRAEKELAALEAGDTPATRAAMKRHREATAAMDEARRTPGRDKDVAHRTGLGEDALDNLNKAKETYEQTAAAGDDVATTAARKNLHERRGVVVEKALGSKKKGTPPTDSPAFAQKALDEVNAELPRRAKSLIDSGSKKPREAVARVGSMVKREVAGEPKVPGEGVAKIARDTGTPKNQIKEMLRLTRWQAKLEALLEELGGVEPGAKVGSGVKRAEARVKAAEEAVRAALPKPEAIEAAQGKRDVISETWDVHREGVAELEAWNADLRGQLAEDSALRTDAYTSQAQVEAARLKANERVEAARLKAEEGTRKRQGERDTAAKDVQSARDALAEARARYPNDPMGKMESAKMARKEMLPQWIGKEGSPIVLQPEVAKGSPPPEPPPGYVKFDAKVADWYGSPWLSKRAWIRRKVHDRILGQVAADAAVSSTKIVQRVMNYIKRQYTIHNPSAILNNLTGEGYHYAIQEGRFAMWTKEKYAAWDMVDKFKNSPGDLSGTQLRFMQSVEQAGLLDSTLLAAEMEIMNPGSIFNPGSTHWLIERLARVEKFGEKILDTHGKAYNLGDQTGKLQKAWRGFQTQSGDLAVLEKGKSITYQVGEHATAEIVRMESGELGIKRGAEVKPLTPEQVVDIQVRAMASEANAILFDYGHVGRYTNWIKSQPMVMAASPFVTWTLKAVHPTKGLMARLFSDLTGMKKTNSPAISARRAKREAARLINVGKYASNAILQSEEGDDVARELVSFNPRDVRPSIRRWTENPGLMQVMDIGSVDVLDPGRRMMRLFGAVYHSTMAPNIEEYMEMLEERGLEDDPLLTSLNRRGTPEYDPGLYRELRVAREAALRSKAGYEGRLADALTLAGIDGGVAIDWLAAMQDKGWNKNSDAVDITKAVAPGMLPGSVWRLIRATLGYKATTGTLSYNLSGRGWGDLNSEEGARNELDVMIHAMVGHTFRPVDVQKGADRYFKGLTRAFTSGATRRMKQALKIIERKFEHAIETGDKEAIEALDTDISERKYQIKEIRATIKASVQRFRDEWEALRAGKGGGGSGLGPSAEEYLREANRPKIKKPAKPGSVIIKDDEYVPGDDEYVPEDDE